MKDAFLIDRTHIGLPISSQFNDLEFEDNDIKTIDGHNRKRQDLIKALITEQGALIPYPGYGSKFTQVVAQRASSDVNSTLADAFKETLAYLQAVEESPLPSERFKNIVSLSVEPTSDSRERRIHLVVSLEDGQALDTSFPLPV